MRVCTKCKQSKEYSEFYGRGDKKGCGLTSYCKQCGREKQLLYRKNNSEKAKDIDLKQSFGIGIHYYNALFNEQDGKCAICSIHQEDLKRALSVDHCHRTGKIRGLLCSNCNTAIGKLKENPSLFYKALEYLNLSSELADDNTNVVEISSAKKGG